MFEQPSTKTILASASFNGTSVNDSIVVFSVPQEANILDITTVFSKTVAVALKSEAPLLTAISIGAHQVEREFNATSFLLQADARVEICLAKPPDIPFDTPHA